MRGKMIEKDLLMSVKFVNDQKNESALSPHSEKNPGFIPEWVVGTCVEFAYAPCVGMGFLQVLSLYCRLIGGSIGFTESVFLLVLVLTLVWTL